MTTRMPRAAAVATALALLLLPLAACASGGSEGEAPVESPATTDKADTDAAGGETYGCTDAILAYVAEAGYTNATPQDPATFEFPSAPFSPEPDCYLVDEVDGATRSGALWSDDPEGVLTAIGETLTGAGYEQSEDYGPQVWWLNGTEPTDAEHAIGAAVQPIDGADVLWATW